MSWCNCDHETYYDILSNIDDTGFDGCAKCYQCGNRINNSDVILLLLREVKRLSQYVQDLESAKMSKENKEFEENLKKEEDEKLAMEKITAESERFNILDL